MSNIEKLLDWIRECRGYTLDPQLGVQYVEALESGEGLDRIGKSFRASLGRNGVMIRLTTDTPSSMMERLAVAWFIDILGLSEDEIPRNVLFNLALITHQCSEGSMPFKERLIYIRTRLFVARLMKDGKHMAKVKAVELLNDHADILVRSIRYGDRNV